MKRVAIIGCSHAARRTPDWRGWVTQLCHDFPNIEFHNFSEHAHGSLWYDFVLKHIITDYPPDYFDLVVVQLTARGRWIFPMQTDVFEDGNWVVRPYHHNSKTIENYICHAYKMPRVAMTYGGCNALDGKFNKKTDYDMEIMYTPSEIKDDLYSFYANHLKTGKRDWSGGINTTRTNMSEDYERYFAETIQKIYSPHFKNFLYYSFFNNYKPKKDTEFPKSIIGNIGHTKPFVQWAIEKYGEEKVVIDLFDNSLHTNQEGENVYYKEYIMNSKIFKIIREINA